MQMIDVYATADGHTNKSAAKALGISVNTVSTHTRARPTRNSACNHGCR